MTVLAVIVAFILGGLAGVLAMALLQITGGEEDD